MAKKNLFGDFASVPQTEPQYPVPAAPPPPIALAVNNDEAPVEAKVEVEEPALAVTEPKFARAARAKKAATAASPERVLPRLGRKPVYEVPMQPFSSRISQDRAAAIAELSQETGKPVTRLLDEALGLLLKQYRKKGHEN